MKLPTLETERLVLRPLRRSDAPVLFKQINDPAIAANTLGIPHPFPYEEVLPYIERNLERTATGEYTPFAIVLKDLQIFIGYTRLTAEGDQRRAELAYWLGQSYWGKGYITEAAGRLVRFGFERLNLNRVFAFSFAENIASQRVMEKLGMTYEGTWRRDVMKNGQFKDVAFYGLLRGDYLKQQNQSL